MSEKYIFKKRYLKFIVWLIDFLGNIFFLGKFFKKKMDIGKIKNILVVRLDFIGDILLATPALYSLRQRFPQAIISMLVSPLGKEMLWGNPNIDRLITYDVPWFSRRSKFKLVDFLKLIKRLREERYDLGIDLRGDFRNILLLYLSGIKYRIGYGITGGGFLLTTEVPYIRDKHEVEHNLDIIRVLGANYFSRELEVPIFTEDREYAINLLRENGVGDNDLLIGLHPGAGYPSKQWAKEKFALLGNAIIQQYGVKIVITGSSEDLELVEDISKRITGKTILAAGKTTLKQLAALIERCNLFISNDSGPMHVAAAVGTPLVAIYSGTNNPKIWGPYGGKCLIVKKDVECSPCELKECICDHKCMTSITVAEVMAAVDKLLSEESDRSRLEKD